MQKRMLEEERMRKEMESCTFKPQIAHVDRTLNKKRVDDRSIKGYQKAIERMKTGYKKNKEQKENL